MLVKRFENHWWVQFEHKVSVEVLTDGKRYEGLGRVKCDGSNLRSSRLPILPLITTTDGYQTCNYRIKDYKHDESSETIVFFLQPRMISCSHTEMHDSRGRCIFNVKSWPPSSFVDRGGEMRVVIKPCHMLLGDLEMRGFTYYYRFKSRKHLPYCIHDRASWEIGKRGTKNTVIPGGNTPEPFKKIKNKKDSFSTAIYESGHPIAQFRPAPTELQPFSYQFKNNTILVTAPAEPAPFHFLVEKAKSHDEIICWRQFYREETKAKTLHNTPPLNVMCGTAPMKTRTDRLNHYGKIRRSILNSLTTGGVEPSDLHGPSGEIPLSDHITEKDIERGIQKLADAACTQVILSPGSLECHISGEEKHPANRKEKKSHFENIIEKTSHLASRQGLKVAVLWSPQNHGKTGRNHEDYKNNLSLFFEKLHAKYGIARIYLDGKTQNLKRKESFPLTFLKKLNKKMARRFCLLQPFPPVIADRTTPFSLISGNEYFYENASLRFPYCAVKKAGLSPCECFFRGSAHKIYYRAVYEKGDKRKYGLSPWWSDKFTRVNMALKAVQEYMDHPYLLRDDKGIIWDSQTTGAKVLWAFDDLEREVGKEAQVYNVMQAEKTPFEGGRVSIAPFSVHLIEECGE